ncbi:MAG: hypothetical protein IH612_21830 [Desulfofustis sp.]|nr:hypothetical protein [Desulfofustis sp.]
MASLSIDFLDGMTVECSAVIVIPEQAIQEAGYIKMMTGPGGTVDKHGLHALAQTACYRFQDEDLEVVELAGPCRIIGSNGETEELVTGMVIYREDSGAIRAAAHRGLNRRKLLETAHRYCTRWVRLDI